ncbi:Wzz/FepE/Etk N-terminal domain-containing protein [Dactylosporangium sp. CS-047395]|uniref:Wzz/FepE/Etk N-terminal domain-containing protein n=1 Tax=Dactylosporangium sp. CS-047395 TaxID=3239936 RepID=UPI003D94155F
MDLGEILRVLRKRWLVVVPMFVLALGLGVTAFFVVPNTYESYTTVSLLSSSMKTEVATKGNDNPFMTFDSSLIATADFLGRSLQSTDSVEELKRQGVTEKYAVALADGAQGPFLTFTVTGSDKAHVLRSTATLAKFANERLTAIQQQNGVKTQDMIRMTEIVPPQTPETKAKKKIEIVLAATGGMIALTLLVTFVMESVSRNKARRQSGEPKSSTGTLTEPDRVARPALPASASATVTTLSPPSSRPAPIQVVWSEVPLDSTVVLDMDKGGKTELIERVEETDQTVVLKMPVKPTGDKGSANGRRGSR